MFNVQNFSGRILLGWRLRHLRLSRLATPLSRSVTGNWASDRSFQLLDLLMVFDLYEAFGCLCFRGIRTLTGREYRLLYSIFGNSLPYHLILIDERAQLGPRSARFCYVSFHTINSWGTISDDVLVHEAVHVWQYVHIGAAYIPRALSAQQSLPGYDYGGYSGLVSALRPEDFNYEQMADLIADAYRIIRGSHPRWIEPGRGHDVAPFRPFLLAIRLADLPFAYVPNRKGIEQNA